MGAGRDVWVKIRASEAERAEWHAKARSAGLTLSDLVRERTRQFVLSPCPPRDSSIPYHNRSKRSTDDIRQRGTTV